MNSNLALTELCRVLMKENAELKQRLTEANKALATYRKQMEPLEQAALVMGCEIGDEPRGTS